MHAQADSEPARSDADTEDEMGEAMQGVPRAAPQQVSRSRATSPSASVPSDSAAAGMEEGYGRLTARQRARLEKEAGIAEDVAWHEMDLLPNLTYTWKGKGIKAAGQMTEEEWLKRQEALERRRMRSLRDKREAEEAVKAKIRRAVTARFRGKLTPGADSGLEGQPGAGDEQLGGVVRPGWVKMRYTADGVSVAWHPAVHPLSLPVPVAAAPVWPLDPIELPLQPVQQGEAWQVPASSSSSFRPGSVLVLQPVVTNTSGGVQHPAGEQQGVEQPPQHVMLHCVDSQAWVVGCLLQQQVLVALQDAGYQEHHQQQQQLQLLGGDSHTGAMVNGLDWQHWRAVVRSVRRVPGKQDLAAVTVRLSPCQA